MRFIDRVKEILLKKNEEDLTRVEEKIKELEEVSLFEDENVKKLKAEANEVSGKNDELKKYIINGRKLKDLVNIYEFIANFPRIEKIVEELEKTPLIYDEALQYIDILPVEEINEKIMQRRYQLYDSIKTLNEKIIRIKDADIEEFVEDETHQKEKIDDEKQEKRNIFFKLFGRNAEPNIKSKETVFEKYRKVIAKYNKYSDEFLNINLSEDENIIDRITSINIINRINYLLDVKKRGIQLDDEDEIYLETMRPLELWKEISRYHSITTTISPIVQNFKREIDSYEQLYKEEPDLFNLENLEKILKENNQMIIDVRSQRKDVISKKKEFERGKQNDKEIKAQLKELKSKKEEIIRKSDKIKKAKILNELGFRNKEDATKKLSIDAKDYIVVPIPNEITNITELFNYEKQIEIKIDEKTFFTTFSNDISSGRINAMESVENVDGALLIPIKDLKKQDIDSIKLGKVNISSTVLQKENILAILPEGRNINFGDLQIEINRYNDGNINKQVEKFLGDDYADDFNEIENYEIFKNIPDVSNRTKRAKREAVKNCLFENIKRDVLHTEKILVDGKSYFLNQEDQKDLQSRPKEEPLNEKKLVIIADEIENYLIEDGNNGAQIDFLYQKLILEYMRVNKKAKSDYYEENNTTIHLKGRKISIKPNLITKDENIAKRYSRPSEDVAYKTMKLANLVNRFAHMTENEEVQNALYEVKLDLVENVIDLSEGNPKINLKRKFDEEKMVMSVCLEIPGYNMVALHIMNKSESLVRKSNQLEEHESNIVNTSVILAPGVNKEFLLAMRNLELEERIQVLLDLEPNTFYKLVLRMGYNSQKISSEEEKNEFIKSMVSDEKISELLKDNDELEK